MSIPKIKHSVFVWSVSFLLLLTPRIHAQDLSAREVLDSIKRGKRFLQLKQQPDGSWSTGGNYPVGITSLVVLTLLNSGMTKNDPTIAKGLRYLRSVNAPKPHRNYSRSLMIMALAAAKDGDRDKSRIFRLAKSLEDSQIKNSGSWSYQTSGPGFSGGDRSNAQYAILGLRDAVYAGAIVDKKTWELALDHWLDSQNSDGGWGYTSKTRPSSYGSMTVAGISSLVIISHMLKEPPKPGPNGKPICCKRNVDPRIVNSLDRAYKWIGKRFAVGSNPGNNGNLLYYLYGMERAGRLSGRRFFGDHDWYREGVRFLVSQDQLGRTMQQRDGSWKGLGFMERDPVIGTSFALLFVSKGLSRVLVNKLEYGRANPQNRNAVLGRKWNVNPDDARNLSKYISTLKKWPKLLTWQTVNMNKAVHDGDRGLEALMQAPVLLITGEVRPNRLLNDQSAELLRSYVEEGKYLFAVNNCNGAGFEDGFRELITKMYPEGGVKLEKLKPDHPIYRAEFNLFQAAQKGEVELWGVKEGCRTSIIYSPNDISCLWDQWSMSRSSDRSGTLRKYIDQGMQVGVNVIAYATGRVPPVKLAAETRLQNKGVNDRIARGFLQVAKIKHSGAWDVAPKALRNLLMGLNRTVGTTASTKQRNLFASDKNIFKYPILYMHGRNAFQSNVKEQAQLKKYLSERGGVLFADACCASKTFDKSFREMVKKIFPNQPLKKIPVGHELFSSKIQFDLRKVQLRAKTPGTANAGRLTVIRQVEPQLEGIEIDGRYVVIYSKYDLSCALEKQTSPSCSGYLPEDAMKIAINVVLYAMLQDVSYRKILEVSR